MLQCNGADTAQCSLLQFVTLKGKASEWKYSMQVRTSAMCNHRAFTASPPNRASASQPTRGSMAGVYGHCSSDNQSSTLECTEHRLSALLPNRTGCQRIERAERMSDLWWLASIRSSPNRTAPRRPVVCEQKWASTVFQHILGTPAACRQTN